MTASDSALSRWASVLDSSLVIHWLEPSAAARRPSREAPNFQMTNVRSIPTSALHSAEPGDGRVQIGHTGDVPPLLEPRLQLDELGDDPPGAGGREPI
ncbi:MAG: hypothetical protein QOF83_1238, partial [Solirubrobacteraceae bacterium]|nr:hypothetical protein [Solirubrobacteraceae bacterium]